VHADWVTYCELDRVRRRTLRVVPRTGDEDDGEVDDRVFWEIVVAEHPVCLRHQLGEFQALKLSDFLSLEQLRRTRLYDVWFKPLGVEHELNVPIPSPLWHTKTFLFDRAKGRDFTERDRLMLDFLQPYMTQLWQAAKTRRLLRAALGELDRADEHDAHGVILLGVAGEVEYASRPAQRLLRKFFPSAGGGLLPAAIREWLESDSKRPLLRQHDRKHLVLRRAEGALMLEERPERVRLTAREREVMSWVARGKTNAEIAQLLWLAPSTVRKHLENVYAKLGDNSRTAAVARFLGLVDAEAV
jgi:DNA-binding CsgD family transcriptional regulator